MELSEIKDFDGEKDSLDATPRAFLGFVALYCSGKMVGESSYNYDGKEFFLNDFILQAFLSEEALACTDTQIKYDELLKHLLVACAKTGES